MWLIPCMFPQILMSVQNSGHHAATDVKTQWDPSGALVLKDTPSCQMVVVKVSIHVFLFQGNNELKASNLMNIVHNEVVGNTLHLIEKIKRVHFTYFIIRTWTFILTPICWPDMWALKWHVSFDKCMGNTSGCSHTKRGTCLNSAW